MEHFDMHELARLGATARIAQLEAEIAAIRKTFGGKARRSITLNGAGTRKRKRRNHMSAAKRAEVSKRMKAYWAEKRKAKSTPKAAKAATK